MSRTLRHATAPVALTLTLAAACTDGGSPNTDRIGGVRDARDAEPGVHRQYGVPVALGQGRARTYAVIDRAGRTLELGVALDERALEGLPAPDPTHGEHEDHAMYLLPLPRQAATAFRFVELDWNPRGHGAPHEAPHFDFHFYTITRAERDAILPSDPAWAQKAAHAPPAAAVPPFVANPATLLGLDPAMLAVPMMGMHWIDVRSPELQMLPGGDPSRYRPFTTTFIYGAWDGQFTFMEPMITRAHILARRTATDPAERDQVIPIPTSPTFPSGAFRPTAYRIAWNAQAREYRIALTTLATQP